VTRLAWARPIVRQLWARFLLITGCLWWANRQLRRRGAVLVLTFHRVLDDAEYRETCSLPGMVVRRDTFERLAACIAAKYQAVDIQDATVLNAQKLRVMLTFDDGWKDNQTNALPVAHRFGIPLTVFVCPGLLARVLPYWPERVAALLRSATPPLSSREIEARIEKLKTYTAAQRERSIAELYEPRSRASQALPRNADRTISWEDIREMDTAGVCFGAHTHTHQILANVSMAAARQEIRESKLALESALSRPCGIFAYPNGDASLAARQLLKEEGFTLAFTTQTGAWTAATDPLAIPRINISESKVLGLTGRFSRTMFRYSAVWKAYRASQSSLQPAAAAQAARAFREYTPANQH